MSDYTRRWLCKECKREWVEPTYHYVNSAPCSITGNPKGNNCPVCGSPEIAEIAFKPWMPGLDIPRDEGNYIELPRNPTLATIPGQVSTGDLNIKADSPTEIKIPAPISELVASEETQLLAAKITMENNIIHDNVGEGIYDLSDMD